MKLASGLFALRHPHACRLEPGIELGKAAAIR
jgi:hypothetical protein